MDFFEQQARAHHKTKVLVVYFVAAVASIVALVYVLVTCVLFFAGSHSHHYDGGQSAMGLWNPQLLLYVTGGTLTIILFGTIFKTIALSSGGSAVAKALGGRLVSSNTRIPDERKLLNVVEEMSIASGVPMPKVYVLDDEAGINAFAAGHTPSDAAVCVTHNCMSKLTRDELQGVIGHEFSHILNGDMRLNIRLIGILFGLFCIATIGRILTQAQGRNTGGIVVVGLLLMGIGFLGVFFGRLIQAAVSRQREFLADASSVQFTRNPGGLSGALQKIGGYGSYMRSAHASDASHLFFANGITSNFLGLMATHPPIEERIRAIDPGWDGKFRQVDDGPQDDMRLSNARTMDAQPQAGQPLQNILGSVVGGTILASGTQPASAVKPHSVMPNLGNPTPLHLKYAEELRNSLPENLKSAAREPLEATALIYALLLSPDDSTRNTQIAGLTGRVPPPAADALKKLYPDVAQTATRARLPLVNLALAALRQLSPGQFSQFSQALQWLIDSDGQVELFEFVLQKIVLRHLDPQFNGARKPVVQFYTLKPLVPDCAIIMSALANVGSEDAGAIQKAFEAGKPFVKAQDETDLKLLPAEQCGVEQINAALDHIAVAAPVIKKNLLEACARVVGADGLIHESEAELLRAIADTLDCPMPPLGVSG